MIGNKYLKDLFEYPDQDTSINQLLELLKFKDMEFIVAKVGNSFCNFVQLYYAINREVL